MLRIEYPSDLPISAHCDELRTAIAQHQVIVVAGETGSGKSTQLPKICLELGRGTERLIGHTQPRRVAARTIAARIASELGVDLGAEVGYSVRFDDRIDDRTRLRVMTDGILLAELRRDPMLERYDTVIIDEAHERSLNIDFLLGYLHQLLPQRPDLKVIITSATIDTERFAAHFAGLAGPVQTIGGRGYPVEIRYRDDDPLTAGSARDQTQAICEAVDELCAEGTGDILVFVSGEREIHDAADALRGHLQDSRRLELIEVLPLYARLSSGEQQRIFAQHPGRRVVVSTNVAETSITVPGIRYVVDTGLARISRYSRRLKVQRLPIEEISQASADQRAGRCGRVAPGICIRLYSEESYRNRPEFTEPEILRTNLAAVILQMRMLGLGEIDSFGFLEPPDRAAWRDGEQVLIELGALEVDAPHRLTTLGRRLARLPVDPRLGRMIIEAERLDCVHEVLVIAAALSIRDPRERPVEQREAADLAHRRFRVEGSDLLGALALWEYLREEQRSRSGNAFRTMCRREFLNVARVREWEDLFSQLRRAAGEIGIRTAPHHNLTAHPDHVHRSVLAGHLSQIGRRDPQRRDYQGRSGSRFQLAAGSAVRPTTNWVMAAELVETDRLRARTVAQIQPGWAETLGAHLVKRSYGEPRWDQSQGRAIVDETVTLFGLRIVEHRMIGLDRVDPVLARSLFIRHGLVEDPFALGDHGPHRCVLEHNAAIREHLGAVAARMRRRDLLDDVALTAFYERVLPDQITSAAKLDRWLRTHDDGPLRLDAEHLLGGIGLDELDQRFPTASYSHGVRFDLQYRDDPDSALDGISVVVPLELLNQLDGTALEWLVPGHRAELIAELARSAPRDIRRQLIPLNETIARVADSIEAAITSGELSIERQTPTEAVAEHITRQTGVAVTASQLRTDALPLHLQMNVIVMNGAGEVVDVGRDLRTIAARQAGAMRQALATSSGLDEGRRAASWKFGDLEPVLETGPADRRRRSYPALVDEDDAVVLRVFSDPDTQQRVMRAGVRRLLILTAAPTAASLVRRLDQRALLAVAGTGFEPSALADDAIAAAVDRLLASAPLPWTQAAFEELRRGLGSRLDGLARDALDAGVGIVAQAAVVRDRLSGLHAAALTDSVTDIEAHLDRLVRPRFILTAGTHRLPDLARYLRGIEYRIERLRGGVERDRARIAEVVGIETRYRRLLHLLDDPHLDAARRPDRAAVVDLGWQLEEWRIAVFAQELGAVGKPSAARLQRELANYGV